MIKVSADAIKATIVIIFVVSFIVVLPHFI
jgi:hypothetical protein